MSVHTTPTQPSHAHTRNTTGKMAAMTSTMSALRLSAKAPVASKASAKARLTFLSYTSPGF